MLIEINEIVLYTYQVLLELVFIKMNINFPIKPIHVQINAINS